MQWSSILWNLLTSDDIDEINVRCETDIGEEMESSTAKKNEQCVTNAHATVMHDLVGPNTALSQIVNCAPRVRFLYLIQMNQIVKYYPFQKNFQLVNFTLTLREKTLCWAEIYSWLKNCNTKDYKTSYNIIVLFRLVWKGSSQQH